MLGVDEVILYGYVDVFVVERKLWMGNVYVQEEPNPAAVFGMNKPRRWWVETQNLTEKHLLTGSIATTKPEQAKLEKSSLSQKKNSEI